MTERPMRLLSLTLFVGNFCAVTAAQAMPPAAPAAAASASTAPASTVPQRQYTFAWQFLDGSTLAPRGGSTKGTSVQLVTEPTGAWKRLQAPGLTPFEKDRRAILAMAGEYRASFDFLEVAGFNTSFKPDRPYQSWGTEKVYVLEDKGTAIVLQHLLVMSIVNAEGKVEGPFVTKHWRQDWHYEPATQVVFRGSNTWQRIDVPRAQRQGQWRQTVYQVDDSPRYSGVAKWSHVANYSTWGDEDGWRPLPRREFSVRKDYQVLIGNNRHTITPTGWVHEQQNLKAVVDAKTGSVTSVIGRELGFNRYERIEGVDWSAGDRYIQATDAVWKAVRKKWEQLFAQRGTLRLKGSPDKDGLFLPIYEYAESVADGEKTETQDQIDRRVSETVEAYLIASPKPAQ